jgi:hypothetical protein
MPPTETGTATPPREPIHPDVRHETRDVQTAPILWFGFALIAGGVLISAGLWGLFRLFAGEVRKEQPAIAPNIATSLKRTPAPPRLEPLPLVPRRLLLAEEDRTLSSYGWIDRPGGVARIPIERAMELVTERGVAGGNPMSRAAATAGSAVPGAAQRIPR